MTKAIEFYFDFSSPYAYIGYKEIKKLEKKNSFKIKYMPIFLGGLHNSAGITPAAFISIKAKYMIRDTKLIAEKKNIKLDYNQSRELIYGMPYDEWKAKHQKEATKEQLEDFNNK